MNLLRYYTDAQLVSMLLKGSKDAFAIIYKDTAADLMKYIRMDVGSKEECEQIMEETYVALLTDARKSKQSFTIKEQLFSIARRRIDQYTKTHIV